VSKLLAQATCDKVTLDASHRHRMIGRERKVPMQSSAARFI
jgi:hypothetical protein